MAPRLWNQVGWGLAVLAMLLCSQMVMVTSQSVRCSSAVCIDRSSYAPQEFIFLHGVGGGAWLWFEIITLLELYGYSATAVELTANGIYKAIADDITTVAEYTKPLIDAIASSRGKVILVGHSLGGGSIAYASEKFLNKVSKAIYLSACTPSYNQRMSGAFPPTSVTKLVTAGYVRELQLRKRFLYSHIGKSRQGRPQQMAHDRHTKEGTFIFFPSQIPSLQEFGDFSNVFQQPV